MQVQKNDIQLRILTVAEELFMQKGYLKTSMREIATQSQVALGNIYNYFPSKDELFRATVRPATQALENMLQNHHGQTGGEDVMMFSNEAYLKQVTDEYIDLLSHHRRTLFLLLFRSQGSSMGNFRETYTNRSTALVRNWVVAMKKRHPEINANMTDFSIHLHTVWMLTLFEEILMHKLRPKDTRQVLDEYIRFEITGWRELMKI